MQDVWSMDCAGNGVIVGSSFSFSFWHCVGEADGNRERRRESTDCLCVRCNQPGIPDDPDAREIRRTQRLPTQHGTSLPPLFVFSLTAPQNEALVGLRNSAILHYDFRIPDKSAVISRLELGKSVCGIKALDETRGGGRSFIASGYTHQVSQRIVEIREVLMRD